MAKLTFKGQPIETCGQLPKIGEKAPDFLLTKTDLSDVSLQDFNTSFLLLSIFPSLDTGVCAAALKKFNEMVASIDNVTLLSISADLPFAHNRFCSVENIKNAVPLSCFRSPDFGQHYGVTMTTWPLKGLLSRAVVILDSNRNVVYTEQVPEITDSPNDEAALKILTNQ